MTATNHVITGMVVGAAVVNPIVAIPLALMAHFVLDALPHYGLGKHTDTKFLYVLSSDMGAAMALLIVVAALQPANWLLIIASGIACASPDLMWLPRWISELSGKKNKPMGPIRRFHAKIQWAEHESWRNATSELVWFSAMFIVLSQILRF